MDATVANQPNWHYVEKRPLSFPSLQEAEHGVVFADCSFDVIILCKLAGLPDPSGNGYSGYGNSTSLFFHLEHITAAEAKIGDAVVFGPEGDQHAAMIRRLVKDKVLCSHGSEDGPKFVALSVEAAGHEPPVTFLRVVPLDPTKPPPKPPKEPAWFVNASNAQPMWAWFAWRDHDAPEALRPKQVPKLIPWSWWLRYRVHKGAGG
jgi:hypothetical protein